MPERNSVRLLTLLALGTLLVLTASLLAGSAGLSAGSAWQALWGGGDELARSIITEVRLPRSLSALAVGSLLALAGTLLQALFRNPLADPFVLGVSGGASLATLLGLLAGAGAALLQWYALAGALAAGALTFAIGRGSTARLLLAGVVIASAAGSVMGLVLSVAPSAPLRGMVFWLAGDLGWAAHPRLDLGIALLALAAVLPGGRVLNVLATGELRAAAVGLPARSARWIVFLLAAALTAVAVLAAGPIGFVGLVAPHVARLLGGSADHRLVAPAAMLIGAMLLCLADLVSRVAAAPLQLPVGAVMALIGAPVFLWLLRSAPGVGTQR